MVASTPLTRFLLAPLPSCAYREQLSDAQVSTYTACVCRFVMDAQDAPYTHAIEMLQGVVARASAVAPHCPVEVFIHKMDGDLFQSHEHRADSQARFKSQVETELLEGGVSDLQVCYHQTSVYDHSVFDAFSRVIQKMLPSLGTMVSLLDCFLRMCDAEKAFLCDVVTKLYLATDSSPTDEQSHELCSDMLDVIVDVSCIYGRPTGGPIAEGGMLPVAGGSINASADEEGLAAAAEAEAPAAADNDAFTFDKSSESIIRLANGMALYMRGVAPYVALVAVIKQDALEQRGLVAYNVDVLQRSLVDILQRKAASVPGAGRHASSSSIPIAPIGSSMTTGTNTTW